MPSTKVALADIHRSLLAFAEGIAQQPIALESATPFTWLWMSDLSSTTITLPESIDEHATDNASNRKLYRSLVLRHIGLQQLGAHRWFATHPDLPVASAFGDPRRPQLLIDLFDLCEEVRVTATVRRQYPGARSDLGQLHTWIQKRLNGNSPNQDLNSEVVQVLREFALGTDATQPLATPAGRRLQGLRHPDATKRDSLSLALAVFEALTMQGKPAPGANQTTTTADILDSAPEEDPHHDDTHQDEFGQDAAEPIENEDATGEDQGLTLGASFPTGFEHSELGAGHAQPLPDDADAPLPQLAEDEADPNKEDDVQTTERTAPSTRTTANSLETINRTYLYDEWSYVHNTTLRNWCRVIEERLEGDDHHFILEARQRNAALARKLEAQLAQLRPRDLARTHRVTDGDDLDLDAIVESIADRQAGHANDDRLYVRKDRVRRDVGAAFLIDLSASTSSPIVPAEPPAFAEDPDYILYPALSLDGLTPDPTDGDCRTILDVSKEAVALMCDALDRLGDDHAIYGFSGHGRDNAEFYVAKDFGQRTSPRTWSALSAMKPRRYTRMGPAIRHTAAKLAAQSARTKLLIMISDGYPQDVDYGEDRSDREYGVHDTARALQDAANQGIDTFCITIDAAGHDYLKRMCPDGSYLVIDEVESLPTALAQSYFNLSATPTNLTR